MVSEIEFNFQIISVRVQFGQICQLGCVVAKGKKHLAILLMNFMQDLI